MTVSELKLIQTSLYPDESDNRTFKQSNHVFPLYLIDKTVIFHLDTHEKILLSEAFLMQVIGVTLKMDHTDFALILGHVHIHIAIERITVVSVADDLKYAGSLAAHVMEVGKIVEVPKPGYGQHMPSNFSTSISKPW